MKNYFIAKVANIPALMKCIETGKWACKDKQAPPHPRKILGDALREGPVIIIFSVNNCHGYHGYATMTSAPIQPDACKDGSCEENFHGTDCRIVEHSVSHKEIDSTDIDKCPNYTGIHCNENSAKTSTSATQKQERSDESWHCFDLKWEVSFLTKFGEQCLPFYETEDLIIDGEGAKGLPLNKCRNWQKLSESMGEKLCVLIEKHYTELCKKRDLQLQQQIERQPKAFYDSSQEQSVEHTWKQIVSKVERDLGKVILACPFGSQRYNLSIPDSDTDMFIVYQAKTDHMLGFSPPKQTIKSSERESCDYTIHEVFRYCELLLSGDARCVETLFLHESTVVCGSRSWQMLKEGRQLLLNRVCLSKYLRDAQGSKGTKYLRKWCDDNKTENELPPKMCKMLYVIVRLLQNARDIVKGGQIDVYRDSESKAWEELMRIRRGPVTVAKAWEIINRLENEISQGVECVPEKSEELTMFLEQWLLDLRHRDWLENH